MENLQKALFHIHNGMDNVRIKTSLLKTRENPINVDGGSDTGALLKEWYWLKMEEHFIHESIKQMKAINPEVINLTLLFGVEY